MLSEQELYAAAKEHQAPYELIRMVAQSGQAAGAELLRRRHRHPGRRRADDAAGRRSDLCRLRHLHEGTRDAARCENDPKEREEAVSRAKAIVIATTHYNDPKILAEVSEQVTGTMKGLAAAAIEESQLLQTRGW